MAVWPTPRFRQLGEAQPIDVHGQHPRPDTPPGPLGRVAERSFSSKPCAHNKSQVVSRVSTLITVQPFVKTLHLRYFDSSV